MSLTAAAILAMLLSFAIYIILATWYLVPRVRQADDLAAAITPLVWLHAFRHIALQIFSSQEFGFPVSDAVRNEIVYGDLAGMVLAVLVLLAFAIAGRRRSYWLGSSSSPQLSTSAMPQSRAYARSCSIRPPIGRGSS